MLTSKVLAFKPLYLPLNSKQEKLSTLLNDPKYSVIIIEGPAGTGKTLLSTQHAIEKMEDGKIKKIIMTRPTIHTGPELGFLPGTMDEKMNPWLMPILDVFSDFYPRDKIRRLMNEKSIEIVPLAYMRGRSFKHAIILADEMQNSHPEQMKMLLTRVGKGSQLIITGDVQQSDLTTTNGLKDFLNKLNFYYQESHSMFEDGIALIRFDINCIERHPIISKILKLYE